MPQIEVKTFKKPQKMISLRNQDYDGKYLVMAESELRIDYLLPFFDCSIFVESIHNNLIMDDSTFIVSDSNNTIHGIDTVDISDDTIGTVTLLKVTTAEDFMNSSTFCEGSVSIQYINSIEKKEKTPPKSINPILLADCCKKTPIGLFRFDDSWYEGVTDENIPYYTKKSRRGSSNKCLYRIVDFYVSDISAISVVKKSVYSMYIKTFKDVFFNEYCLSANSIYKINYKMLGRSSNNGTEYFMQKSLIRHITDCQEKLNNELELIINGGK